MKVRIKKDGAVWAVIHSRPQARNTMEPDSAGAFGGAFRSFDADPAVLPKTASNVTEMANIDNSVAEFALSWEMRLLSNFRIASHCTCEKIIRWQ